MGTDTIAELLNRSALLAGTVLLGTAALAHHSIGGEFDNSREVMVTGTVKEFALINPHTYIVVAVEQDGATTEWTLTFGPATKLIRGSGFTPTTLVTGDVVTAKGRPARKGRGMYLAWLAKSDGTVLIDELEE
jgi:Family of unknown function (DUF6152)